ncbi:MAG: HAMP domain-containing protein, partial [Actinobacteria bacterium]|nr:HAMP domain-containing protein [Actinomycetota bacterium]
MTLRARIVLVTVALFLVALVAANFATYYFVSSFLLDRVDDTLRAATTPAAAALVDESLHAGGRVPPSIRGQHRSFLPDGSYAALIDARGRVERQARFAFGDGLPRPKIPQQLLGTLDGEAALSTVTGVDGETQYRLIASPVGGGRTVAVAVPLSDARATRRRLVLIQAAVSLLAIALLAAAAYWATRVELRPLERMAQKAGAIAGGDLSQRVDPDNPRTEVGRLGGALNAMLARIEQAFAERLAAEERLRQFVADASHELRTPVTSIRGYAELFRRGAADRPTDLANVMRRIEEEGARMGELVEELLLLARLDDGTVIERQPVELAAVVDAAVAAARAADPQRAVTADVLRPLIV